MKTENDIEIIHASLTNEVKRKDIVTHNLKSAKCPNGNNDKSNFDERMDVSSIESDSDDNVNNRDISENHTRKTLNSIDKQDDAHFTKKSNFEHTDDQIVKYENELQVTDDEESHIAVKCNTNRDKSPIKLKKSKHEPKTRFSLIDVVDLSDEEEGVFPYSQLFDIKYEDNTENNTENNTEDIMIKQECDDLNTEKIVLLNDEVIILTDSEDEDNPWLERLSRSQLLNEDTKPVFSDTIVKDEVDLGIWDDENAYIMELPEIPNTSQVPCSKEISPKSRASIDVAKKTETKNKKDDYNTNLQTTTTEINAMDVDEVGLPNELTKNTDKNKQVDININVVDINDKSKQKTDVKQDIEIDASKQTIESVKQKLTKSTKKLIPVIEPLHLPTRRKRTDHSKDKVTKVREPSQSKSTNENKISKLKEKFNDNFYKEQKRHKEKSKSVANSSPSETKSGPSISKDEKKKRVEDRKMKLKKIAAEEKKLVAENGRNINRRIAKPRAKISLKNRGDFLIAEQEPLVPKSLPNKSAKLSKSSDDQSKKQPMDKVIKKSTTSDKKTQNLHHKTDVSKDTVNNITTSLQQSLHLGNMSTASEESTVSFRTTDANEKKRSSSSNRSSSKSNMKRNIARSVSDPSVKMSDLRDRSIKRSSLVQKENFSPNSLKSNLVKSRTKSTKNKRVSFSDKFEIKMYEIDRRNTLKKLDWKDAPIPTNKLTRAPAIYTDWSPKLEEFLLRIFMWNPVWLEEQRYLKREPPIVSESELQTMRLSYDSYKQYYQVAMPLLLLEIWCTMTKDFETVPKNMQRATMMCSIVENSVTRTPIPSTNLFLTTLMLEVLVNRDDLNKQTHPVYGDLVYLEYVTTVREKQIFHKVFGYITNMQHMIITDFTQYNKDLRNYVKNPYSVITYTLLTRPLDHAIPVNRVQRVRTVTYLRSSIRMVQALQYLPHSPLLKLIVSPKIENYQLPPLNDQYTSSSLVTKDNLNSKQLEAVFRVTDAVLKKDSKLCFIQGPPGTGKSKVIVNLVTQILYGERQNEKSLRILICAPSNAAIDEIVLRLLNIRSTLRQKRFNMVRIGRLETMHPKAKAISVTELAKRYLHKMTKMQKPMLNGSSVNIEDIAILQARINSLESELESTQLHDAKRSSLLNKLFDASTRCELLKSGKSVDELNPKDRAKYQRMSENIIITGANIIACTLSSCYTNQMESIFGGHKERISVCIVDEATQSCEAETLIPLMLGVNTLVLVGDPNQLPATILSQRAKKLGLDQSVFSRIQNVFGSQPNSPIIMLDTQYRMDYAISYWPNRYFYGGRLKNDAESKMKFPFHSYRVLNHDFTQNNDKFSNTTEAEFVANIIFTMLMFANWETTSATISLGVLTPYNNQRTLVLNKINEK